MTVFIFIAILNGMLTVVNKMVNIEAKKHLGLFSGSLVNYVQATIISLIILIVVGKGADLSYEVISNIPLIYFIGGVAGLLSMLFTIKGMENAGVVFSTVIMLIGQLGIGFIIDAFTTQNISIIKLLGIFLIIIGITLNKFTIKAKQ